MKPRVSTGSSIKTGQVFNCIFKNVWYGFSPYRGSEVLECKCFSLLCVIPCVLIFNTDSLLLIILVMMNTWPWHTHTEWTSAVQASHCGIYVWLFWLLNDHGGSHKYHNKAYNSFKFIKCFVDAVHLKEHVGGSVLSFCRVVSQQKC